MASTLSAKPSQAATPAAPQPVITSPDQLDLIDVSVVTKVLKPDLIRLQNKKTYRLDEIRVPPVYSQVAMAYLTKTLVGKKVGIYADKYNKLALNDSYGNGIGSVVLEDATWVQNDMVSRGIAWPTARQITGFWYANYKNPRTRRAKTISVFGQALTTPSKQSIPLESTSTAFRFLKAGLLFLKV